jgi:hypothetical protein
MVYPPPMAKRERVDHLPYKALHQHIVPIQIAPPHDGVVHVSARNVVEHDKHDAAPRVVVDVVQPDDVRVRGDVRVEEDLRPEEVELLLLLRRVGRELDGLDGVVGWGALGRRAVVEGLVDGAVAAEDEHEG